METMEVEVREMEQRLRRWGAKLDEVMARAEAAGVEARSKERNHIDHLKGKRDLVQVKLDELKAAGTDKWQTFVPAVETALDELEVLNPHGQVLLAKVMDRKQQLTVELSVVNADIANKGTSSRQHADDIDRALSAVSVLLAGNLGNIDEVHAAQLSQWLATSSLLTATLGPASEPPPPAERTTAKSMLVEKSQSVAIVQTS